MSLGRPLFQKPHRCPWLGTLRGYHFSSRELSLWANDLKVAQPPDDHGGGSWDPRRSFRQKFKSKEVYGQIESVVPRSKESEDEPIPKLDDGRSIGYRLGDSNFGTTGMSIQVPDPPQPCSGVSEFRERHQEAPPKRTAGFCALWTFPGWD